MKKILIAVIPLLLMLFTVQTADAQSLPEPGDRTFEITTAPFSNNPVSFNELRLRSFQSEDRALRIRGILEYARNRFNDENYDSEFFISLAPGLEWHLAQHERISLFYGAELPISYFTTREHRGDVTNKNVSGGESFGIGLNALAGVDLHFLNSFYTGVEVRYGIRYRSGLDAEVNGETVDNDSSVFIFTNSALPRFRLGVKF
jgi:hypothetical protein